MEGAILSTQSNNRIRTHLKNAASALCARTLPKQRRVDVASASKHHTYPRSTPPKRVAIPCRMESSLSSQYNNVDAHVSFDDAVDLQTLDKINHNDVVKLKGSLAREVATAWGYRVGAPDHPAPADKVQSLFNDIELYPTKTQVFEMLVCARQCASRKSLILTFGEFCVFAAELRRCSRQARQTLNKPESPQWTADKELRDKDPTCKPINGSEASPPPFEVFLGGSCNPTTWRSDIAIPLLKKMGITYFNPQVDVWSTDLVEVEYRAKAQARALLFVLDSETRTVAASVEAAHLAAAPRDLLLVLRPYQRHQKLGDETISDQEYVELSRGRATLQEAVERRGLPAFTDIVAALRCARAVIRGARTHPRHALGHTILRLKRVFDAAAAGERTARLQRCRAVDALREVTRAPRELLDRVLPPNHDTIDFETFCAAVAELACDTGVMYVEGSPRAGRERGERGVAARLRRALCSLRHLLTAPLPATLLSPLSAQDVTCRPGNESAEGVRREERVKGEAGASAGDGAGATGERVPSGGGSGARDANALRVYNDRLRAYGRKLRLFIPKNGNNGRSAESGEGVGSAASAASTGGSDSSGGVLTPGTEQRLERLPAMVAGHTYDVYLGGAFPSNSRRPEEVLRNEGYTFVVPRANDYTRMFSAPARRSAPAHPESPHRDKKPRPATPRSPPDSPHRDKKPRPATPRSPPDPEVQLRDRDGPAAAEPCDRLSASDFYKVTEDITPQPFKGTYEEEPLLRSRVLVFSLSSESPCFSAMVLAAHYMGLRPGATVLLVQAMDPAATSAHPYSEAAVKDYNRGRHYLADLARRSGVAVFDNIDAAMACVLNRLRNNL